MLIDTHCHLNIMVKDTFDIPLKPTDLPKAQDIVLEAKLEGVSKILNVGTSLVESQNCIDLAQFIPSVYAAIGIHPNDLTTIWQEDLSQLAGKLAEKESLKIVAIGECGLDKHYPDFDIIRQQDAFKAQIELALLHNLPLVVHTRDAGEETLRCLEQYKGLKGTIHCFSEDLSFAEQAISWGFVLGIGGTITYPKNNQLREVVKKVGIEHIILETDAPFLPPQTMRGKQNHPKYIHTIAEYIGQLLEIPFETVASTTSATVERVFNLNR
jgi:TatD DNase family protein